jgi:ribosomal-protein-alanine N-acetyltransferase
LLAKFLRGHPGGFFVAEVPSGTIVGYCVASEDGDSAHLISIGVLREYRRRRVGTALIQALLENVSPKVRELRLEVKQGNAEAIKLYKDLGFRQVNLIENYYEDGSPALKMRLTLHNDIHEGAESERSETE